MTLVYKLQGMDRGRSALGSASVQHAGHSSGCRVAPGGVGPATSAKAGQRDGHLSGAKRAVLAVLRYVHRRLKTTTLA